MRIIERSKALKIAVIALLVTVCLSLPAYFLYLGAKGLIIEELNKNAINIAATAAVFIEQDIEAYKEIPDDSTSSAGNFNAEYYSALQDRFDKIMHESGAARIFTDKRIIDGRMSFLAEGLAGQVPEPPGPPPGSRTLSPEERRAFDEGIKLPSGLMRDETRGEFITGYAPIFDSKTGKPVGIVGVEFTVAYAHKLITGFGNIIWINFFVIMLLTSFVIFSLINSRVKYYKEDYLTGLFNKRYFEKNLQSTLRYVKKTSRKLSLVMIDVDSFKSINDTLGHAVGDAVLKSVAKHLRSYIRSSDICSRYGGDEFIITLFNTSKQKAFEIAERIRKDLMAASLRTETGDPVSVSLSMGIAESDNVVSAEKLIERADKALYISKKAGKNLTTVYDEKAA